MSVEAEVLRLHAPERRGASRLGFIGFGEARPGFSARQAEERLEAQEVAYLLAAGARTKVEAAFLRSLVAGQLSIEHVGGADLERAAELVASYADLGLGGVDAVVVAIAERLGASKIATLDRRHFTVVRPAYVPSFE